MKLAMSSWSYHQAFKRKAIDHDGWLRVCAEIGLDGVELLDAHMPPPEPPALDAIAAFLRDHGLEVACVSVSNDFGLPTDELRDKSEAKVRRWLDVAAAMQAPVLRVFAGWPAFGKQPGYASEKARLWDDMVVRLRRCAEATTGTGVVLGLENHNHGGFTATVEDLVRILDEVAHPALKVTLDTGDYIVDTAEVNGYAAVERAAPHAAHVHAKLYTPDASGSEPTHDWPRILRTLATSGYDGYVSIEYEGKEDPMTAVPRGARHLRASLREHAAHKERGT